MPIFDPTIFDPTIFDTGLSKMFDPAIFDPAIFDTGEYIVITLDAVEIVITSAKLKGSVTVPHAARGFIWGKQSGIYTGGWYEEGTYVAGQFEHTIEGLDPNTQYFFRAKARLV
jgi:hypothetical protein